MEVRLELLRYTSAKSLLRQMNSAKTKASSADKITPAEFKTVKKTFPEEANRKVLMATIIFNWDQLLC